MLIIWIFLAFYGQSAILGLGYALLINIVIALMSMLISYCQIRKEAGTIVFQNLRRKFKLRNIEKIETWWCYKFAGSTADITSPDASPIQRGHVNTIYLYATLSDRVDSVTIYEEIYMSDKFPNGHPYLIKNPSPPMKTFKVWDVDKCISKLELKRGLKE